MAHINRRYIDSHWLIPCIKGVVTIGFGFVALFSMNRSFEYMVTLVGAFLLSLSVIEFINALYRAQKRTGWGIALSLAIVDAIVAISLLFTLSQNTTWHLVIISAYTFIRGFCEIVAGFATTDDPTDRFTWVFGGMCGAIVGLVIFNSGEFFIRFFGVYLVILGTCSLFYGVHNRAQKLEDREARRETARLASSKRKKSAKKRSK